MEVVPTAPGQLSLDPAMLSKGEIARGASEGALWRAYLTSVPSKPIIREELRDEVQTAA